MLGHDLVVAFSDYQLTTWSSTDLDISNEVAVRAKITALQPDIIINAAAYTNVDGAEKEEDLATIVNGTGVGYLAEIAHQLAILMIHFSTDYVFEGTDKHGYIEDAATNPVNAYGHSKEVGEKLLQERHDKFYLIRTSWLYGKAPQKGKPRGLNFVETMLSLAQQGREIKVVNDQFGKPTFTHDLAQATRKLVEDQAPFGTYHLVNEGVCSWYDFAKKIFEIKGIDVNLHPIGSKDYPLPTPRSKYSILINTKTEQLRSWEEALRDYLKQ